MNKPKNGRLSEIVWEKSWKYIKTIVDIVREPILILDKEFRVMAANEPFYRTFQVDPKDTEGVVVYNLGNGQWDIPALRKLLEDILPKNTVFKGFEVSHDFPFIGKKMMILNARQIHFKEDDTARSIPPIILLAMEDVTDIMMVAETLSSQGVGNIQKFEEIEKKITEKTIKLEKHALKLEKEINSLKSRLQKT